MPSRLMTADVRLSVRLQAAAQRAVYAGTDVPALVEELYALAGDRRTVLAEAAGVTAGYWSLRASDGTHQRAIADALLGLAGVDAGELARWVEVGRARAGVPRYRAWGAPGRAAAD